MVDCFGCASFARFMSLGCGKDRIQDGYRNSAVEFFPARVLPEEQAADAWLLEVQRFWAPSPISSIAQFFESLSGASFPFSAPILLPACSKVDESRLYEEAFKSPFNLKLFSQLAAKVKNQARSPSPRRFRTGSLVPFCCSGSGW